MSSSTYPTLSPIFLGLCTVSLLLPGKAQYVGETLVKSLQNTKYSINEKLEKSFFSVFSRKPNISSDVTNNAKDMDDDTKYTHDKQYQTDEVTADGLGEKHGAVEMDGSKSSDEDADIKKVEIVESVNDSDEDNFAEHVEFNDGQHRRKAVEFNNGQHRRKAIFGYDVDSGDPKGSYEEGEDDDSDEGENDDSDEGEDDDNDNVDSQVSSGTEEREDNGISFILTITVMQYSVLALKKNTYPMLFVTIVYI